MTTPDTSKQKAADAAFFEDWSEWESLDGLTEPDKRAGYYVQWPARHSRYWCKLRNRTLIGGPAFELCLPSQYRIERMVEAIPGTRRQPGRYHQSLGNHIVPAEHWRQLRAILPALKAAIIQYVGSRT